NPKEAEEAIGEEIPSNDEENKKNPPDRSRPHFTPHFYFRYGCKGGQLLDGSDRAQVPAIEPSEDKTERQHDDEACRRYRQGSSNATGVPQNETLELPGDDR